LTKKWKKLEKNWKKIETLKTLTKKVGKKGSKKAAKKAAKKSLFLNLSYCCLETGLKLVFL